MARKIAQQTMAALKNPESTIAKRQRPKGLPSSEHSEIPEEDKLEMEEAIETIRGLIGN